MRRKYGCKPDSARGLGEGEHACRRAVRRPCLTALAVASNAQLGGSGDGADFELAVPGHRGMGFAVALLLARQGRKVMR